MGGKKLILYCDRYSEVMPPRKQVSLKTKEDDEDDQLRQWVSNQRKEFTRLNKGYDSTITPSQVSQLNLIGFQWGDGGKQ